MSDRQKDTWDRALIVAQIMGAVFTPLAVSIVGAFIAYALSASLRERELSVQEMTQAMAVLQADKDDTLKDELHAWAAAVIKSRTVPNTASTIDSIAVAASDKETAERLCFKPSEVLLAPADELPKLHAGDDLVQAYVQLAQLYSDVRWRHNRMIRSLKISCGYLNKSPEQLQKLIDVTK